MNPTLGEAGIEVGDRIGLTHNAPACSRGSTVTAVFERTLAVTCDCGRRFSLQLTDRYPIESRASEAPCPLRAWYDTSAELA